MYQDALEIVEQLGEDVGIVRYNLGNLELQQGHPERARAHYEAALEVARRVGNPAAEGLVLCNLGELQRDAGDLAQAEETLGAALYLMRELGDRRLAGHLLSQLAWIRAGDTEWASERLDEALPLLRASGDAALLVGALRVRAEVCSRVGDHLGVEAALAEAEAVSPADHAESREVLAHMRLLVSDDH